MPLNISRVCDGAEHCLSERLCPLATDLIEARIQVLTIVLLFFEPISVPMMWPLAAPKP